MTPDLSQSKEIGGTVLTHRIQLLKQGKTVPADRIREWISQLLE